MCLVHVLGPRMGQVTGSPCFDRAHILVGETVTEFQTGVTGEGVWARVVGKDLSQEENF